MDNITTAVPDSDKDLTVVVSVGGDTVNKGAKLSIRNVQSFTIQTIMDNFLTVGLGMNSTSVLCGCSLWKKWPTNKLRRRGSCGCRFGRELGSSVPTWTGQLIMARFE